MGFDVSYHPISADEAQDWYFKRLPEIAAGDSSIANKIAQAAGMEEFYIARYIDTLNEAVALPVDRSFEATHGWALCIVQGFFRTYHYTRNSSLTDFFDEHKELWRISSNPKGEFSADVPQPSSGKLQSNYASGVWLPPNGVLALLEAFKNDASVRAAFEEYFCGGQAQVVLHALEEAAAGGLGLYEASEVIEPNPMDLNSSKCLSNLFNCNPDGALLYSDTAMAQLKAAGVKL